jgi:SAM-dependent methyltransferase
MSATLSFYDRHAASYSAQTRAIDMNCARSNFAARLPLGGRILDAGCGSGRDTKAFREAGFEVVAFDGSPAMAAEAGHWLGRPVLCLRFEALESAVGNHPDLAPASFDGIWASASLLHLAQPELVEALRELLRLLKPEGLLYASFKYGHGARTDAQGRFFLDLDHAALQTAVEAAGGRALDCVVEPDASGREQSWLRCVVAAAPAPTPAIGTRARPA